jgi:hypothetical protein
LQADARYAENGRIEVTGRVFSLRSAGRVLPGVAIAAALGLCAPSARAQPKPADAALQPTTRIALEPLGFAAQGNFYMTYRLSSASMGFLDNDHLLFTFRPSGLMKRIPGDDDGNEDQDIRAAVVEIGTGKVDRKTDWRMHDRSRYMWPLADGKFLIRIRNSFFLTDNSLELKPYLTSEDALRAVQVSPDRSLIALETDDPAAPMPAQMEGKLSDPPVQKRVRILILPAGERTPIAASEARSTMVLPLVQGGMLETLEGSKAGTWAIREVLFDGDPKVVADVKSACQPTLNPVSGQVTLVVGCYQGINDQRVVALSKDGRQLWEQRWQNRYIWPTFDYAQNGSRFAYATLDLGRGVSALDPFDSGDVQSQMVGVFDTETGKLELVKDATPVMSAGQNYALSADGRRFAIVRQGAIEVYDLPPVPASAPVPADPSQAKK